MRTKWGFVAVCAGLVLFACLPATAGDHDDDRKSALKTVKVNCEKGDSITKALEEKADELIIEFEGTCYENVVIERDNVTIRGVSSDPTIIRPAEIDPGFALTVIDSSKIDLVDFTVRDSWLAVSVDQGSSVVLEDVVIRDNEIHGLVVNNGSSVTLSTCTATGNGGFGFSVWGSSSLEIARDTTSVASENWVGLVASGASSFGSQGGDARFEAYDNETGIALQLEAGAQANSVVNRNAVGLQMYGGTFAGLSEARDNGIGVWLDFGSQLESCDTLTGNDIAIWARCGSIVHLWFGEVSGNDLGILLEGSSAWIRKSTISDDMRFEFGSRVDFSIGNSITGPISCDDTVLTRGDYSCPATKSASVELSERKDRLLESLKEAVPFTMD